VWGVVGCFGGSRGGGGVEGGCRVVGEYERPGGGGGRGRNDDYGVGCGRCHVVVAGRTPGSNGAIWTIGTRRPKGTHWASRSSKIRLMGALRSLLFKESCYMGISHVTYE